MGTFPFFFVLFLFCYVRVNFESFSSFIMRIDKFHFIKIFPKAVDLSTRLWGINTEFKGVIPQSRVLKSIVLG